MGNRTKNIMGSMKRILITFLFLLITTGAGAEFFGSGEFGYTQETRDFYTLLELGYRIHLQPVVVSLYGGIEVLMEKGHSAFFHPYRDIYTVGGSLKYQHLYFNVEHKCIHAVHAYDELFEDKFIMPDSRTRFGVGFEF